MNTEIHVLLLIFQNIYHYFWMITWIKNVNNFQIAKVQSQGVTQLLLNSFFQFQPDVAYKSVAYKKKRVFFINCCKRPFFGDKYRPKNLVLILFDQSLGTLYKFQVSCSENEVNFDFPREVLCRCQIDCICYWKIYKSYGSSTHLHLILVG